MALQKPNLSVVLPCYNEAQGLSRLLERYADTGRGRAFELILVDNGSTDKTATTLQELLPRYPFARSVRVVQNQGYGFGVLSGLLAARGEVLAWSHADLQTDAADVFRAYDVYCQAPDATHILVKGRRTGRALGQWLISRCMELVACVCLRHPCPESNAQPKLFHREIASLA